MADGGGGSVNGWRAHGGAVGCAAAAAKTVSARMSSPAACISSKSTAFSFTSSASTHGQIRARAHAPAAFCAASATNFSMPSAIIWVGERVSVGV